MTIIKAVDRALSPATILQIGASLGLGEGPTRRAIAAAVPAVLADLGRVSQSPDGSADLDAAVSAQDPDVARNFARYISSSGRAELVHEGGDTLTALIGSARATQLVAELSRFTGLGRAQCGAVLGALTPLLLGRLAHVKRAHGLDGRGLAGLLASQREEFRKALPAGLRDIVATDSTPAAASLAAVAAQRQADQLSFSSPIATETSPAARPAGRRFRTTHSDPQAYLRWVMLGAAIVTAIVIAA